MDTPESHEVPSCDRREHLSRIATAALTKVEIMLEHLMSVIESGSDAEIADLSEELKIAFEEEKRAYDALVTHSEEHGC